LNRLLMAAALEARHELRAVETEPGRGGLQIRRRELGLIGKQRVVELPEFVLVIRASRGLGGVHRVNVERQREIEEHDLELVAILLAQSRERRDDAGAERTLEVA